ncbi:HvfC/BufC family peptide modification chaperone [Pseudomonas sp. 22526]|uniref:HvfC/BufC family peptide modification chaperone n=1 Tax=Pseudomonas sp. 22526 TaxID=3453937 RepID=UPI003F8417B4
MPSLHELQDAVRRSIIERDDVEAITHIAANGIAPPDRLSIYRNTFRQTLIRALRLSYPAVDRLVGADFFGAAAADFVVQHPPRSSYLDEFGGDFAAFLEQFAPAASVPYLADVARLEWAVSCALHAPDAEPLSVASLGSVDAADYAQICFTPHPSVSLIHTMFPADVIWCAVLEDNDAVLAAIDLSKDPAWLIVQRGPSAVDIARLDEALWRFVSALCAGCPLGAALGEHSGIDATAALADLLTQQRFTGFRLALRSDPP